MPETASTQWAIAPHWNAGIGEIAGASLYRFKLHNIQSGLTHGLTFKGVGIDIGFIPVSAGYEWTRNFERVRTPRPLRIDEFDERSATMLTGSAYMTPLDSGPRASYVELIVWEGYPFASKKLFHKRFYDATASRPEPGDVAIPNSGVTKMNGNVTVAVGDESEAGIEIPWIWPQPRPLPGFNTTNTTIPFAEPVPVPTPGPKLKVADIRADVAFDFDSASLKKKGIHLLGDIRDFLDLHVPRRVTIEGHTDSIGSKTYNQNLSEQRARAVKRWFVEHGVKNATMFVTKGHGELRPLATNATGAGRKRNRRVEIFIEN